MHRAFVAFSGGGAKGVVHVSALKALEDRKVRFVGLSGTSAGAIVAALAAAGFRSTDIVDVDTRATIMDQLRAINPKLRRATDLFGDGWARIRLLRLTSRLPVPLVPLLIMLWLLPLLIIVVSALLWPSAALLWFTLGWAATGGMFFLVYRALVGGLADVCQFRDALAGC